MNKISLYSFIPALLLTVSTLSLADDKFSSKSNDNLLVEENNNLKPDELPDGKIDFKYTFGPYLNNQYSYPSAILSKKNNQLNLEIIGSAGSGKCYRNLIPSLEFNIDSITLYFNAQLTGCEKIRIIFNKDGMRNEAQIFEADKWSSFARIKNIQIKDPNIIFIYLKELIANNQSILAKNYLLKKSSSIVDLKNNNIIESKQLKNEDSSTNKQTEDVKVLNDKHKNIEKDLVIVEKKENNKNKNNNNTNEQNMVEENLVYQKYFQKKNYRPQLSVGTACLTVEAKTICTGDEFKQLINTNNLWDLLGVNLNSPIDTLKNARCLRAGSYDKNSKPIQILIDGIECLQGNLVWDIRFQYDREIKYFFIEWISLSQCAPFQIQVDSEIVNKLNKKYGEPKFSLNSDTNLVNEIRYRNNNNQEEISISFLRDRNLDFSGKIVDCGGGSVMSILLSTMHYADPNSDARILLDEIKKIKRNIKSSSIQPEF